MIRMTDMVKHLLIINIIFFVGSYILPNSTNLLALHYFESDKFQFWQPITHMFMHGNIMHIFFNMFALVSFGSALEQMWGSNKFLFFYFSCGIGAALLHTGVNYYQFHNGLNVLLENGIDKEFVFEILNQGKYSTNWTEYISQSSLDGMVSSFLAPAVGASGAIYGLLVAFAFMFPNAALGIMFIPIPIRAKYFVPAIVLMDLFSGVTGFSVFGGGVAHFAHVGGALFGFILMWIWRNKKFTHNRWN